MNSTKGIVDLTQDENRDESAPLAGLRLNFHKAPIHSILNYLHDAAHLPIEVECDVEINSTIELWNEKPVSKDEAIRLLKDALDERGYTAVNKGRMLAIIKRQDAKKYYIALPTISAFAG